MERADVVLMVIEIAQKDHGADAKIAGIVHERGKGVIIVVNKWDAIEKNDRTMREYESVSVRCFLICRMRKLCMYPQRPVKD